MRLSIQERERRKQEKEDRTLERRVKAFRKNVITKDLLLFKKDENGFITFKYHNGQTFKCRGPIVERAGLL